jgi:hypothetical protein
MRLLPRAIEGFRGLSIILALVSFVLILVGLISRDIRSVNEHRAFCDREAEENFRACLHSEHGGWMNLMVSDQTACEASSSLYLSQLSGWVPIGLYATTAAIGAWITALCVRMVGWTVDGFMRTG